MHFQYIWVLALILVVSPVMALVLWFSFARKEDFLKSYGERRLIEKGSLLPAVRLKWLRIMAAAFGSALVLVALSRPTIDSGRVEFPQGSTDVMVLVDVSRSMAALDYKGQMPQGSVFDHGTRLDMARHLIREEVVPSLGANRLGIVTFAGDAFPLAFLTNDVSAVDWVQKRAATINSAPGEGSGLVKAFELAFRMFDLDSDPSHRKIIILFSDGGNDDGLDEMNRITELLRKRGIDLLVIGLGKTTPSKIPIAELSRQDQYTFRNQEFYTDGGEESTSTLDENVLRLIANRAGGKYVRIQRAGDFSFSKLTQRLEMTYRPGRMQLFVYPLLAGFAILAAAWFLGERLSLPVKRAEPEQEEEDEGDQDE
jgi:Ca-activated chloride channel family protein